MAGRLALLLMLAPALALGSASGLVFRNGFEAPPGLAALNDGTPKFGPGASEAEILAAGAAFVEAGSRRIYIGTHQATGSNQNPIVASFTDGGLNWINAGYEIGGPDGRGMGVLWDGADRLYVAFTVDGGGSGLERFTAGGWLSSYGSGGGAKATVLLRLDPASGAPRAGTFVSAVLSSGRTNTLVPTDLAFSAKDLVLFADSFFGPRDVNRRRMTFDGRGDSPFPYRLVLGGDLGVARSAEAIGWDGVTDFSLLP